MDLIFFLIALVVSVVFGFIRYWVESKKVEDIEHDSIPAIIFGVITLIVLMSMYRIFDTFSHLIVDYWWFKELSIEDVWITQVTTKWAIKIVAFTTMFTVLAISEIIALAQMPAINTDTQKSQLETWSNYQRYVRIGSFFLKVLVSALFSTVISWKWPALLTYLYQVQFSILDPIWKNNISEYIFTLPAILTLRKIVIFLFISSLIYSVIGYLINIFHIKTLEKNEWSNDDSKIESMLSKAAYNSQAFLIIGSLIWMWGLKLKPLRNLISGNNDVLHLSGSGFVDLNARSTGYDVLFWVLAVCIGSWLINMFTRKWKTAVIFSALPLLTGIVFLGILPLLQQKLKVDPIEITYESPYLENQLEYTKKAYQIDEDHITDFGELTFSQHLTKEEFQASNVTLSQARIMDWAPLRQANETLQAIPEYYNFHDTDVDRYEGVEYMPAIRELNIEQLPEDIQSKWLPVHLQYTHGYGFTVANVSKVSPNGEPILLVKDIPPVGPNIFMVERPEIYFGELTDQYIIVNTGLEEFDRPEGENISTNVYDGPAGIPIENSWRRFIFAVRFNAYKLLTSNLITNQSKVLFDRSISQSVSKMLPGIACDGDPYPVLGGYEVTWVLDCYTTSNNYPYSAHQMLGNKEINYIRGSIKVTVGAFTGEKNIYVMDTEDPIIRTWMNIFPSLFSPIEDMPSLVKEHLRYPDDLIRAQANMISIYHVDSPEALYNSQDIWQIAKESFTINGDLVPMDPRYVVMVLPTHQDEEFVSNIFFTKRNKANLVAELTARIDGDHYGELILYEFPRDETVLGPELFDDRINKDDKLSQDISLWNQQGSQILWGNTIGLYVPGDHENGTILFIKSLYLKTDENSIPAVTRVIIGFGEQIIYARDLPSALQILYGNESTSPSTEFDSSLIENIEGSEDAIIQAYNALQRAQACSAEGDWECFGQEMDRLETILETIVVQNK